MIFLIISILLLLPYILLLLYYRQGWAQQKTFEANKNIYKENPVFITVIVPARNEEENIDNCIHSIIKQTYNADFFEVVVVDDYSSDATAAIVKSFTQKNVRLIQLSDFEESRNINSYKKKAIETAMSFAKGTLIVTTDADCTLPQNWLHSIAKFYQSTNAAFIAAPVTYSLGVEKISFKKFFQVFQLLDFMMLQGITAASIYKKIHNMCNGANLAYEKKVFYEVGGFKNIDDIASGDDMLLMHKIQQKYPGKIGYLKSQNAIAYTLPLENLKDFLSQRIRWASKADKYPDRKIISVLFLVYFFNAWIFFLAIASLFSIHNFYILLILIAAKTSIELFFLLPVAKFFNQQKRCWWLIPAQPVHIIYTLVAGWLGKFGSYTWKDRKVK